MERGRIEFNYSDQLTLVKQQNEALTVLVERLQKENKDMQNRLAKLEEMK